MIQTKKRLLIVGLALVLLLTAALFVIPNIGRQASAMDVWDGTKAEAFDGGTGTQNDPYQICDGKQLAYFAYKVNEEGIDYTGKYLELTADIDLDGREWTPIGSISGSFSGKFSGNGHTISGVNVNVTDPYENAGLFGFSTGVIMNVAVEGKVSGTSAVGGICGGNSAAVGNGIISACIFDGTVTGTGNNVGGICGYNFANSKISDCFSYADVNGNEEVGGICGYNEVGASVSSTISVSTVSGNKMVGAVCGKNDGTLTDNYFDKNVCDIAGAKDANDNEVTGGATGKTTEELCGAIPSGFDPNVWTNVKDTTESDPKNERKRTVRSYYPSITGVGEAYSVGVKEYNFSTNNSESWKTYTEISTAKEFIAIGNDDSKWSGSYVLTADIDLSDKTVKPIGDGVNGTFSGNFSGDRHTISGVKISSTGDYVGLFGFAGDNSGNRTTIMNLAVEGNIKGKSFVGGICGYGNEYVNIFACSFKGSVSGGSCVGGICGGIYKSYKIENCFNSGTVSGESNVGGLLGYVSNIGNVNYSINVGKVSGTNFIGPICGAVNGTLNAKYNYYNSDIFSGTDSNGTPKTTEELCGALPSGLSGWTPGRIETVNDTKNARKRTLKYTYPCPDGIGEAYSTSIKQYNFSIDYSEDWQEYTEVSEFEDFEKIFDNIYGNYVLMNDIDLKDKLKTTCLVPTLEGKFSGDGHTISGVNMSFDNYDASLFSSNYGTIMYLAVKGDVAAFRAGGICGTNNGTIYGCSFEGSVTGSNYVGGICVANAVHGKISSCYAIADLISESDYTYVGGIAAITNADIGGNISNDSLIENCYFAGTITGELSTKSNMVGAIYGRCEVRIVPVKNCYYNSDLCDKTNDGEVTGLSTSGLCSLRPDHLFREGYYTITPDSGNDRMRTLSYSYPRLSIGCAAYERIGIKQYNFKTDGNDDWQEYTEINSAADLAKINENINGCYVLMNDIDFGKSSMIPKFNGKFSGNGHIISGVKISAAGDNAGLFGENNGLIMYLAAKGNVSGGKNVGGICGTNGGIIYGCSFEGSVKGSENVGGICGINKSTISNCYVIGSVEATNNAGGICGTGNSDTIEDSYFSGTVTVPDGATKDAISSSAVIDNCYYNRDLYTATSASGTGLTTVEMTASDAISKMFLGSAWEKKANIVIDGKNKEGVAYYPSLKESKSAAPSVNYTAEVTFERTGNEPLTFLDTFECKFGGQIEFETGRTEALNQNNCDFTAACDGESVGNFDDGLLSDTFTATVIKAGKSTYTFLCKPKSTGKLSDYLSSGGLTKSFTVNAAKYTLTADDFEVDIPSLALCRYNGKAWTVTAKIKNNTPLEMYKGCGDITVKYYDYNNTDEEVEPINAGDYLVKLDVSESENCYAATGITADNKMWYLGINRADYNPAAVDVVYNWATTGEHFVCIDLPTDMGKLGTILDAEISGEASIISKAHYEDGKVYFTFSDANDEQNSGNKAIISVRINCQNYEPIFADVYVTLNGLANQEAPGADDFDLVLTNKGSDITAEIRTDLTGVEYSFDGTNWSSDVSSISAEHDKLIIGYIRYAEVTDEKNASTPSFKKVRSGHGDLSAHHHDKEEPTCVDDGRIEYWECTQCSKKFSDAEGMNEVETVVINALGHVPEAAVREHEHPATCIDDGSYDEVVYCSVCHEELSRTHKTIAKTGHKPDAAVKENEVAATCTVDGSYDEVVYCSECNTELSRTAKVIPANGHKWSEKYESDKSGHWHKCEVCGVSSEVEKHISDGAATTSHAETCKVCGYQIAPKKTSGGGSSGGSGGSGGGRRPSSLTDSKPSINGVQKGWTEIAADIGKLADGDSAVITLNGETTVPADVIKAIAKNKLKIEFVIDSAKSWIVDGAKITTAAAADFTAVSGNADRSALRGTFGVDLKVTGTGVPSELKQSFRKDYAGQFANVYKLADGKLIFSGCVKIGEDGSAVISGANAAGEYVVMVCKYSDLRGDMSNDGVLNALDAAAILKDIVDIEKGANPLMGDFNGDGNVNALDASAILKLIVGMAA